ncbi:diguanylate cyclase [Paracoccus sp. M683]|uniref:diguanylate cyclase n=1 Tax=Paracoccus sp. M683 TaxID=2594268 RepID=UPI00117D924A|nr:diguanylate cyclase [Paracoccus sp. M683]TRW98300.1 diguanylate cyclase [Paracoccus sp. M683]
MNQRPVVLIVDDEIANIEMIGAVLEDDYEILFARSGNQAIEIARKTKLDLILLDIVMPGLDGYETCRLIKQDPKLADLPVIFTTGLDSVEYEVQGLAAGAIDYVTKPVQPVALRRRVGNHVEMKQMRDRLTSLAMVDPLTGLGNRRMLEAALEEEISRMARESQWLSMILVDIDFFKQFNDIYGHLEGDKCLQAVAKAIGAVMRRGSDHCTRFGGEEFACVLPKTDLAGALHIAEQMRRKVEDLAIPHAGSKIGPSVTISSGVLSRYCERGMTIPSWIESTDKLLYESKNLGRNRVTGRVIGLI